MCGGCNGPERLNQKTVHNNAYEKENYHGMIYLFKWNFTWFDFVLLIYGL